MFSESVSTSKQGDDSKSNLFQERGNDANQRTSPKDPLEVLIGPITRTETKRVKEKLIGLILDIWADKLQINYPRPSCTFWDISRVTGRISLKFQLGQKLDILSFPLCITGLLIHLDEKEQHG